MYSIINILVTPAFDKSFKKIIVSWCIGKTIKNSRFPKEVITYSKVFFKQKYNW